MEFMKIKTTKLQIFNDEDFKKRFAQAKNQGRWKKEKAVAIIIVRIGAKSVPYGHIVIMLLANCM